MLYRARSLAMTVREATQPEASATLFFAGGKVPAGPLEFHARLAPEVPATGRVQTQRIGPVRLEADGQDTGLVVGPVRLRPRRRIREVRRASGPGKPSRHGSVERRPNLGQVRVNVNGADGRFERQDLGRAACVWRRRGFFFGFILLEVGK